MRHESRPNNAARHSATSLIYAPEPATSLIYAPEPATSFIRTAGNTSNTRMSQISILLQQSNYTIHTSQAGITSRTSTQRTDFSEAEESTDSNDNDGWLSWQAVRGRYKKGRRPRTTKVPTMKKNKQKETNSHPRQITITNIFRSSAAHRNRGQY
jgi:hypothetical protein